MAYVEMLKREGGCAHSLEGVTVEGLGEASDCEWSGC